MSRSGEAIRNAPIATMGIIGLCSSVYVCQLAFDPDLHHYTMNPRMIIHLNEYYRVVTSSLFHGSLMHIGMNMMSTAAISSMLETRFGTLRHIMTILWAILLTSFTYIVAAVLLHLVFGMDDLMYQHAVGFSGVIFHMSVLECNLMPLRSRSLFGFITVPSYIYPWALLFALQVIMPNLSFMGHLAGILTGTLQLYGVFDCIMVGEAYLQEMEKWAALRVVTSRPNFISTPVSIDSETHLLRSPASLRLGIDQGLRTICKFVMDVAETIKICIFGRGRERNINIHWGSWRAGAAIVPPHAGGIGDALVFDEEDDWVGLPSIAESDRDVESRMV